MNALMANEVEEIRQSTISEDEEQRFRITNLEQATWAMRKLRALAAKETELREIAQAEIFRVQAWLQEELKGLENSRQFFTGNLEFYHRQEFMQNPKLKTIKTPYGKLMLRAQQPEYQRDEAVLKEWAKEVHPEALIPQEPKLDWAGLKSILYVLNGQAIDPTTGEVVPGVTVIDREPKFSLEVDK